MNTNYPYAVCSRRNAIQKLCHYKFLVWRHQWKLFDKVHFTRITLRKQIVYYCSLRRCQSSLNHQHYVMHAASLLVYSIALLNHEYYVTLISSCQVFYSVRRCQGSLHHQHYVMQNASLLRSSLSGSFKAFPNMNNTLSLLMRLVSPGKVSYSVHHCQGGFKQIVYSVSYSVQHCKRVLEKNRSGYDWLRRRGF